MSDTRAAAITSAAIAVVVAATSWLLGLQPSRAALLAVGVLTIGAGRSLLTSHAAARTADRWPSRPAATVHGTRRDVLALSWNISGRRGTVSSLGARRLRAAAARELAAHGIDVTAPDQARAAERLLGSRAHAVVTADPETSLRFADLVHTVDVLDQLVDRGRPPATAPSHAPEPHP